MYKYKGDKRMDKYALEYLLKLVEQDQQELLSQGLWNSDNYKESEYVKILLKEQIKSCI